MTDFLEARGHCPPGSRPDRSQQRAVEHPPDLVRIDVWDAAVLLEWCKRLGTSPERLIAAVIVMGDQLADVQRHLNTVKTETSISGLLPMGQSRSDATRQIGDRMPPDSNQTTPLSPELVAEMAKYEITRVPADYFVYRSYRYTNLADALAQARREQAGISGKDQVSGP